MLENENDIEKNNKEVQIYEVGYLLVPIISEEEVSYLCANLKEIITTEEGKIFIDEIPKMINLAYEMSKVVQNVKNKYNTAYFGWIKFEMNKENILNLKKKLDLDRMILRFLILKTVKENTIASKRFGHREIYRKRTPLYKKEEENVSVEINKEEIDKEIDALVAV